MSARSGDSVDRALKDYFERRVAAVRVPEPPAPPTIASEQRQPRRGHAMIEVAAAAAIAIAVGSTALAGSWWREPNALQRAAAAVFSEYEIAQAIDDAVRLLAETHLESLQNRRR